ncbi:hypothetical protein FACS1894152_7830 [Bacilli bacterium]|nr:hypothetical protein FACS1894152_7830 [Bacilli bacterium]
MRRKIFFMLLMAVSMGCGSVFGQISMFDNFDNYLYNYLFRLNLNSEQKSIVHDIVEQTEKVEKFCINGTCYKTDDPKIYEKITEIVEDDTNSSNYNYLRNKIILDNSRIAFVNLMDNASENSDGQAWVIANYNRIKHDKQDAANIGGFSAGVRILDNRELFCSGR